MMPNNVPVLFITASRKLVKIIMHCVTFLLQSKGCELKNLLFTSDQSQNQGKTDSLEIKQKQY